MIDEVENDSCRKNGIPPPQAWISRSIEKTFPNDLGEYAWAEIHVGGTCDILLEGIRGINMKKQPFKKIKGATDSRLSLQNVKEILNTFFLSPFYKILPPILKENTIVLSSKYTSVLVHAHMHARACTHAHTHTHLPRKLIFQKGNFILKHLDFSGQETNNS